MAGAARQAKGKADHLPRGKDASWMAEQTN
jgi:hypothetical protein